MSADTRCPLMNGCDDDDECLFWSARNVSTWFGSPECPRKQARLLLSPDFKPVAPRIRELM